MRPGLDNERSQWLALPGACLALAARLANAGSAFAACRDSRPDLPPTLLALCQNRRFSADRSGRQRHPTAWKHFKGCSAPTTLEFSIALSYFHNGFAADLHAVVDFYNDRFHIGFTKQEKSDLVAFLRSL